MKHILRHHLHGRIKASDRTELSDGSYFSIFGWDNWVESNKYVAMHGMFFFYCLIEMLKLIDWYNKSRSAEVRTHFAVQDVKKDPSHSDEMTPQHISEAVGNIEKYYLRILCDWRSAKFLLQLQLSLSAFSSFVVPWGIPISCIMKYICISSR